MQGIVLLVFLMVAIGGFASVSFRPLRPIAYFPELLSIVACAYVLLEGARRRFRLVAAKYWLAFGALALVALCGVVTNGVQAAPLLSGLRFYLRAMPFFFLPAVLDFSDAQIDQQLRLLLGIGLLQFPVSAYQRWIVWSHGRFSGDNVTGTLLDSGTMSIYLICAALVLTGMYMRGRLTNRWRFLALLFLLLFPTSINETKASAIFIPAGFLITILVGARKGQKVRALIWSSVLLASFAGIFIPVYNLMYANTPYKYDKGLVTYFTDQKKFDRYMTSHVQGVGTTTKDVRRWDAIQIPAKYLAEDPVRLALGLGIGSTSPSTLGRQYEGRYHELFDPFLQVSFTYFILEIGALGVSILLLVYLLIFADAVAVARFPGISGGLAVGWTGVTVLLWVSLFYLNIHMSDSLSYIYWYLSGVVAARHVGLAHQPSEHLATSGHANSAPAAALAASGSRYRHARNLPVR